jgi:hypothetical protein
MTKRLFVLGTVALFASSAFAGTVLFTDGMSTGAGWTVSGTTDSAHTWGYDYSADGIPAAPNGGDTFGLKLEANIVDGLAHEISASRSLAAAGYTPGAPYTVQTDIWANFELASGTSTEFAGAGGGHDGATAGRNGASLLYTGDGGSVRDYRMYKDAGEQFIGSLQYNPAFATNNGGEPAIAAAFPGIDVALATSGPQQIGLTDAGDGGFQWMTMLIEVDPSALGSGVTGDLGVASFTLTSAASGSTLLIGTLDNSNGGTVVDMEGSLSMIYGDLFASLSAAPQFQFGLYDNVIVTEVPEPATALCLLGLGALAMIRRR